MLKYKFNYDFSPFSITFFMLKTPFIMCIKFNFFAVRVYTKKNFVEHQIY